MLAGVKTRSGLSDSIMMRCGGYFLSPLGGSWVVISQVISPLIWVFCLYIVHLLMTPLITTHEPPSKVGTHVDMLGAHKMAILEKVDRRIHELWPGQSVVVWFWASKRRGMLVLVYMNFVRVSTAEGKGLQSQCYMRCPTCSFMPWLPHGAWCGT